MLIYFVGELKKKADGLRVLVEDIRSNSFGLVSAGFDLSNELNQLENSIGVLQEKIQEIKESEAYKKEYEKSYY